VYQGRNLTAENLERMHTHVYMAFKRIKDTLLRLCLYLIYFFSWKNQNSIYTRVFNKRYAYS